MDIESLPGHVPGLSPVRNIRELGGIEARDGLWVRRGLLYRGSVIGGFSASERRVVDALGIRCVLDLRSAAEADEHPDELPDGASYQRVAGMYEPDGAEMDFSPDAIARMQSVGGSQDIIRVLYLTMVRDNPALHALVGHLAAGDAPLYFHCSAGKDRTGIAAALILTILGASDQAIIENFLLTNAYRAELINNAPDPLPPYLESIEMWRRANSVHEADLRAVLAAMGAEGAEREGFLAQEYGLGAADLAAIRERPLFTSGPHPRFPLQSFTPSATLGRCLCKVLRQVRRYLAASCSINCAKPQVFCTENATVCLQVAKLRRTWHKTLQHDAVYVALGAKPSSNIHRLHPEAGQVRNGV